MTDMEAQIILSRIDDLAQTVRDRFDDQRAASDSRHAENVASLSLMKSELAEIKTEAKKTNGRITTLEADKNAANNWPSLKVWLAIVAGTLTAAWFMMTQLLGFVKP